MQTLVHSCANMAATMVTLLLVVGCGDVNQGAMDYRLTTITRGPIASTVSATGTLKAVVTVDVGTQVSGLVKSLEADFNSAVSAGQVIARIDPKPFGAVLSQAEAELAIAKARVSIQRALLDELEADLVGARAALTEASDELERKRSLLGRRAIAASAVKTAVAEQEQANALVTAGLARLAQQRAQIELAQARVLHATAVVEQRRLDLDYTKVRSPVDGVVISRNVDAGQTVAASLQAPVLFQIAGDLRRMEVNISVDEADIGRVREGQEVYFTVDSFMERTFEGRVHQIRMAGQQISNVVTYAVVANANNLDRSLLPGMTANVTIVVETRDDVLRVPTAALRLRLPGKPVEPIQGSWVWVIDKNGDPQQRPVVAGIANGTDSEVVGGELVAGQRVIVGIVAHPENGSGSRLREDS